MFYAYREDGGRLLKLSQGAALAEATWIDLYRPMPEQAAAAEALGVHIPSLADMEEIEISNRLYRENGADYMTAVLPGLSAEKLGIAGPVTFILTPERLVTVRHHAPRPFETFPERADRSNAGCASAARLFLGLIEEIIARLADLLEGIGRALDGVARDVYGDGPEASPGALRAALVEMGRQGELLGRVRLGLLTTERMVSYFGAAPVERHENEALRTIVKGLMRDMQALEVHADFLGSRVALITDATLGIINLGQSATVRIVSVVAAIFLPPTLIASAYGMNFEAMPELEWAWGYPMAIAMMVASAVGTYLFFKWRNWL
jgi:magnesium transporter